jgi:hypothetical protein
VKEVIVWDVMPCNLVEVYGHFGVKYCVHLYGAIGYERNGKKYKNESEIITTCFSHE